MLFVGGVLNSRTRRSLLPRRFDFPQDLQDSYERIQSSLSIVSPDIASAQETLECWAEGQFGPGAKLVAPAVYWLGVYVPAQLLATVTESARAWKKKTLKNRFPHAAFDACVVDVPPSNDSAGV